MSGFPWVVSLGWIPLGGFPCLGEFSWVNSLGWIPLAGFSWVVSLGWNLLGGFPCSFSAGLGQSAERAPPCHHRPQALPKKMCSVSGPGPLGSPMNEAPYGCGSKNRYQNGTLVSGNMDQNLRSPSCLILSHTHMVCHFLRVPLCLWFKRENQKENHCFWGPTKTRHTHVMNVNSSDQLQSLQGVTLEWKHQVKWDDWIPEPFILI